jgi:DNA-binding NtrC family response regulator
MDGMELSSPADRRILIVDDDPQVRAIIGERLQHWGFEAVEADSGHAGLMRIIFDSVRHPIHGVLLDLHMPILGGMAVLQEMREQHPTIPVIVMSEVNEIHTAREAVKLGAREYVMKPFDHDLLKAKCFRVFFE